MDTAAILAKMGRAHTEPIAVDTNAYGPWFRMMSGEVTQTDEQLSRRDIGSLNLEAALGLPWAEGLDLDACVQKINLWAKGVREYTRNNWPVFQRSPERHEFSVASF